jgi:hypothetical protein
VIWCDHKTQREGLLWRIQLFTTCFVPQTEVHVPGSEVPIAIAIVICIYYIWSVLPKRDSCSWVSGTDITSRILVLGLASIILVRFHICARPQPLLPKGMCRPLLSIHSRSYPKLYIINDSIFVSGHNLCYPKVTTVS